MASVVQYDPASEIVVDRVTLYLRSANTPDYSGQPNTLINPNMNSVKNVPQKYWIVRNDQVKKMSPSEQDLIDEAGVENSEASDKENEVSGQLNKYYKMLKRLDNKRDEWSMTPADVTDFIEDFLADTRDLKELYSLNITEPLTAFIDNYDSTNPKFIQSIQDELIGILNS